MTQLPVPVHVGSEPLAYWDDIEDRQRQFGDEAALWLQEQRRPGLASASLDWKALGFEPRWVGSDTADCAAALQPSIFSGKGAAEFDRFRQGAQSRGELALVISAVGRVDDGTPRPRSVFSSTDDSVHLGQLETAISSSPIGAGATARAADNLGDADRQLALRLLNCNPPLPWRALSLYGMRSETYNATIDYPAQGSLEPIIVTELGEPVVAAWVSPDDAERRYVVPIETPWPVLLQWLIEQALPEFVPGAMRRARRHMATDPSLMTRDERAARAALVELEEEYADRHAHLTQELAEAEQAAAGVRDALLYGTGTPLVDAVRSVLEWAGVGVVDLDARLGGTKNADLLCTHEGLARLVEVKSASGNASERSYQDLMRHLREWDQLPSATPVDGGTLVINHEHRTDPRARTARPFGRREFLAAQTELVVTTLDLFEAWRELDVDTVRRLVFGDAPARPGPASASHDGAPPAGRKRGWLRRG